MKKILLPSAAIALLIIIAAGIFVMNTQSASPENLKLSELPKKLSLSINSRYHLKVKGTYDSGGDSKTLNINKSCKFASDDESLVQISNDGYITGKKVGKSSVSITYGKTTKRININIKKKNSTYVAHRGAMDFAPHGTIAAIQKAVDLGYQQIECDIRVGGDGNIFVFHDTNMKAMCGVDSDLSIVTLKNRKKFPIIGGSNVSKLPTQYIPTVEEVLDIIEKSPSVEMIYLHVKHAFKPKQARMLEKYIRERALINRVTLITSSREILRSFDKSISKGQLCNGITDVPGLCAFVDEVKRENIGINAILYRYQAAQLPPDDFVLYAHTNGIRVISYAIDDYVQIEQLRNKGVNGIVCNKLLFKLDPSLIKCAFSIKDADGSEASGDVYEIKDTTNRVVASFTKTSEPYRIDAKLNSDESYTISKSGEEIAQSFTVENTDEIQNFVFELSDLDPSKKDELKELNLRDITLKAGKSANLVTTDGSGNKLTYSTQNNKLIRLTDSKVTALKKGTAKVTVTNGKNTLTFNVRVTNSPRLSKKSLTVSKGKTATVKIKGKAKGFDNIYSSSKTARITSKKSAKTIRIRGLKKGSTTLNITVNGKRLSLKVTVK